MGLYSIGVRVGSSFSTGWSGIYWEGDIWAKIWMKVEACRLVGGNDSRQRYYIQYRSPETDDEWEKRESVNSFFFPFWNIPL